MTDTCSWQCQRYLYSSMQATRLVPVSCMTYHNACILLILHISVMEPNKLFMLTDDREFPTAKLRQGGLSKRRKKKPKPLLLPDDKASGIMASARSVILMNCCTEILPCLNIKISGHPIPRLLHPPPPPPTPLHALVETGRARHKHVLYIHIDGLIMHLCSCYECLLLVLASTL